MRPWTVLETNGISPPPESPRAFLAIPHGLLGPSPNPASLRKGQVPKVRPRAGGVTSRAAIPGAQYSHAQGKPGRAKRGCVSFSGSEHGLSLALPNSCSSAQCLTLPWDLSVTSWEHTVGATPCPALCRVSPTPAEGCPSLLCSTLAPDLPSAGSRGPQQLPAQGPAESQALLGEKELQAGEGGICSRVQQGIADSLPLPSALGSLDLLGSIQHTRSSLPLVTGQFLKADLNVSPASSPSICAQGLGMFPLGSSRSPSAVYTWAGGCGSWQRSWLHALLSPLSWESTAGFRFHELLKKEVSRGLTWRGHACSHFTVREREVDRKGKYCKHFDLCFLPL